MINMAMRVSSEVWVAGFASLAAGCGIPASSGEAGGGSASSGASSGGIGNSETGAVTGGPSTSTGVVDPPVSTGAVGTDGTSVGASIGCPFICETTEGLPGTNCDNFAQDCPDGQKCAAWIPDGGGAWNALKCVPVTGDKQPGEPCFAPEAGSGLDDCAEGVMCWDLDENNMGFCVALCSGSAEAPVCPDQGLCNIWGSGELNLCFPSCDPLAQDCPGDGLCIPNGDGFVCVIDASGDEGQANDVCEFINVCDRGLVCLKPAEASSACDPAGAGCCQPFCEFPGGGCPNPDQACVQWYDPMELPQDSPKLKYGICKISG